MALSRLSYLAVKKQSDVQTAVKPTNFIRFKEGDVMLKQELIANNPIQNNRWGALNAVPGKITADGSYKLDLDYNECVHWFAAALGNLVTTDVSSGTDASVFLQTITVANSLYGLSIEQGKGNLTDTTNNRQNYQVDRAFGAMVDNFKIAGSDGIISLEVAIKAHGVLQKRNLINDAAAGSSVVIQLDSAEGFVSSDNINTFDSTPQNEIDALSAISIANKTVTIATLTASFTVANKAKIELQPQTPSYSVDPQVAVFQHAKFQFGVDLTAAASASNENCEDWEFSFENDLEERFGSLRQSPSVIAPKQASAKLTFTRYFENVTLRDQYLNLERKAGIITMTNDKIISATDTANKAYKIVLEMSDCRFSSVDMPTGTNELYAISTEAELFYDKTDGRALRMLVTNATASAVYT